MACREAKMAKRRILAEGAGSIPASTPNNTAWQRPRLQIFHILMIIIVLVYYLNFVKQASRDGSPVFVENSKIKNNRYGNH